MHRDNTTTVASAPAVTDGRVRLLLAASGVVMTGVGIWSWASLSPADRSPLWLVNFVVLPLAIMTVFGLSHGLRGAALGILVALLDTEAVLMGALPVEGMAVSVAIPLIGVALVTYLLPVNALRAPYIAAWLASTVGVMIGVVTWVDPHVLIVPAWSVVPVFSAVDAAGLIVLWQVSKRRETAIQAISEAESRFRELLEGVDLLAADIDRDGRLAWANEYGARLLGLEASDVVGQNWYETFIPAERRAEALARLEAMKQGHFDMPRRRESEVVTSSGDRRVIRWSHVVRHDEAGRFASMASIGEDVTAIRASEEALRQASELNKALVESSPVPTAVLSLDRIVQVWNPALEDLLGWRKEEVLGKPLPDLAPPGLDVTLVQPVFGPNPGTGELRGEKVPLRRKDGAVVQVRIYATALFDAEGKPWAFAAQAIDVTAQDAMEAKLRESQKMEAVGRLAGGVAHDFNNSLTAIGGFAALISSATEDAEIRQHADAIASSVRRSANLTRELLAYARRSFLQPEALEVNAFLASIRPMLRRLLGEDVELAIESSVSRATVRVDPGQFEQALLNLAVNARDAMPRGGRITIGLRRVEEPAQDGATRPAALGWIAMTVTDTGAGIPAEIRPHVFDPFFTTKPVGIGTGLGLAMVQGFVLQSGGVVTLASEAGDGTTIEIRLPEAEGSVAEPAAPVEDGTGATAGTILFVEDEPAVASVGFQILSRRGYRVLLADSGTAAIALLRAHKGAIQLVLSDVILPDMRGPQVAEAARETHPEAAILYASGYSADTFIARGEMADAVELIQKPYSAQQLTERARAAIERHSIPAGSSAPAA